VGAIVFSENGLVEIRPEAREAGVRRILAEVVRQNAALGAGDARPADPGLFNEALRRAAHLATHDWLICPITDAAGADAESVRLITGLTAHNDVLTIFVHDPLEAALPDIGRAVVAESGQQIEVDTSGSDLRRRFAGDFARRQEQVARFSRHHAIPVLPVSTDRDVSDQFRELLGRRLAHRAQAA
jgi:uncharacterized protein (DUF58 family)